MAALNTTKEELLRTLPPEARVMDCAHCGRLMSRKSEAEGLLHFGGYRNVNFHGYSVRRPHCVSCFLDGPGAIHDLLRCRTLGQADALKRLWGIN